MPGAKQIFYFQRLNKCPVLFVNKEIEFRRFLEMNPILNYHEEKLASLTKSVK